MNNKELCSFDLGDCCRAPDFPFRLSFCNECLCKSPGKSNSIDFHAISAKFILFLEHADFDHCGIWQFGVNDNVCNDFYNTPGNFSYSNLP